MEEVFYCKSALEFPFSQSKPAAAIPTTSLTRIRLCLPQAIEAIEMSAKNCLLPFLTERREESLAAGGQDDVSRETTQWYLGQEAA